MKNITDIDNISLFDTHGEKQLSFGQPSLPIDVVKTEFIEAERMPWEQLFEGFNKLYAVTYSSSVDFICKLADKFSETEIIFGCSGVISDNLHDVIAFQHTTEQWLREEISKNESDLTARINAGTLRLFVLREQLSHEKIYLLEAEDGRKRVVMGSANMSNSAFSGKQRENRNYMEGDKAFGWYYGLFEELRENSSDVISTKALLFSENNDNIEELPIAQTVKVRKVLLVEQEKETDTEMRFALEVKNLSNKYKPHIPKADKDGKINLSPEFFKQTRRRLNDEKTREKELRSVYPQLVVNIEEQTAVLNGKPLDLDPSAEDIQHDVTLFLEYMSGYKKFHGDAEGLQSRYFEFANWYFATPFFAALRNIAVLNNRNVTPFPVFGLLCGKSKAGKTSFLETLLKMMIGQKTKISAPEFTRSTIEKLKCEVKGAPIIVDDLTQERFRNHAVETIKNDEFGVADRLQHYPAVVISANEDVKAVEQEIIRRVVVCHVNASLKNTEVMKSNVVRRVQNNIGTAFYSKYLKRMLDEIPEIIELLRSDEETETPDVLALSSRIIVEILSRHTDNELPFFVRELTLDNYFSEKVTGINAIKIIRNAWNVNRKAFVVDRRSGQLRYNTGDIHESNRILKELPEDLEAHKSREWIVMDLKKSCEYFEVNFLKRRLF